jgi:glycine oxidase
MESGVPQEQEGVFMSMHQSTDVVIVGGGVIGCSIAYFLRKAGVEVMVIEREEIAAESSGAAGGLITQLGGLGGPPPFTALMLESWSLFATLIAELEDASGVDIEYRQIGCLRAVLDEDESEQMRKLAPVCQSMGIDMQWVTGGEAHEMVPMLTSQVLGAAYAPQVGSISAPAMTRAYAGAAHSLGAVISEHLQVTGFTTHTSRVTGVQTVRGETIACNHLVIAAGSWSTNCGEWLGVDIPLHPAKGQILALRQPEQPLKHSLMVGASETLIKYGLGNDLFLVPKPDGTIYAGSTVEHVGFDKNLTVGGIAALLADVMQIAPDLANAPIAKMWTGLRPWSADGYPILGQAPGWENVSVATGHGSIGLEASAVTGKVIAELVTTGQVPDRIRTFGLERFARR